ncbi:hypothetical protein BJ912DRAFT_629862 [Pholiota molesta]|nr:hypothetical protein BJ912DRAFT_629862 [Pholiota molesta]
MNIISSPLTGYLQRLGLDFCLVFSLFPATHLLGPIGLLDFLGLSCFICLPSHVNWRPGGHSRFSLMSFFVPSVTLFTDFYIFQGVARGGRPQ